MNYEGFLNRLEPKDYIGKVAETLNIEELRSIVASLSVDRDYCLDVLGMKVRAHVLIEGDVQGVGFRASAWRVAQKLGVTGWVRNVIDGRVEAVLEGEKPRVEKMVQWCSRGPPGSYVVNLKVEWLPYKREFRIFEIQRTVSN